MSETQGKQGGAHPRARGAQVAATVLVGFLMTIVAEAAAAQDPADVSGRATLAQATAPAPQQAPAPPPAPPPKSPQPAPAPQLAAHEGTPATVIDSDQAEGIIGMQVRSASGADMGRIVDLVVDRAGQVRAAVIDFGGFLGVGTRQIAVDWNALHFPPTGKMNSLVVGLDRNQLKLAPIYKAGEPIVVLGRPIAPAQPPAALQKHP
jgi:hypothetical protein